MRCKRGGNENSDSLSQTNPPKLVLRYRDDNSDTWSADREISLGFQGDREIIIEEHIRGHFRTRQYEVYTTDNVSVALSEMVQYFDNTLDEGR